MQWVQAEQQAAPGQMDLPAVQAVAVSLLSRSITQLSQQVVSLAAVRMFQLFKSSYLVLELIQLQLM
jgi:hypothetical protein